jgi:LEA14-like dessication related protein
MREIRGRAELVSAVFTVFVVVLLGIYGFYQLEQVSASGGGGSVAFRFDGIIISGLSVAGVQSVQVPGVTIQVQFRVSNPTPVSITLQQLTYSLYGNGNFLGNGTISKLIKISADSSSEGRSTFAAGYVDAGRLFFSYLMNWGRSVSWRAIGTATISIAFQGVTRLEFNCTDVRSSVSCTSDAS